MPTTSLGYRLTPKQSRDLRAKITARLVAKGLTPGAGKWSDVFARHLTKERRKLFALDI